MKQEDKLRNTLREYYDTQQVPFNDNEWERTSVYISAARRGRKIRYAVVILTTLLSTLFITLFNFPKLTSNAKHQTSSLSNQKLKSTPAPRSATLLAPIVLEPKRKISVHSNPNKRTGYSAHAVVSAPGTGRNNPKEHAVLPSGKASQVSEAAVAASEPALIEKQNAIKESQTNATNSIVASVTHANITAADNSRHDNMKTQVPEDSKENVEMLPVAAENLAHDQNQFPAKEISQGPIDVLPQTATTLTLNDNKKEIVAVESEKYTGSEEKVFTTVVDTSFLAPVADTATAMEIAVGDTLPEPSVFNPLADEGIFYEAGAAWNYGWKGPAHRDARGFSPVVGINYMDRLTRRCAISFGLQYVQVNNLSNSSKTSRVSTYVYGESSSVTVVTPSTLHYILAPLRFHYYVNHQNSFGAGINLAYLLNVDAKVTSYDEKPGFTGNYKTIKLSGYTEGFSWFDSQLAFFYRRRIGSSLALQTEIFIGLTDVKQNEFFGFNNKERNSGAKLSLIYYAFRKKGR